MNKFRKLFLVLAGICLAIIVMIFTKSLGQTYIESSNASYEIVGMKKLNTQKFNQALENFTRQNKISAIKVFNILSEHSSSDIQTKMHVFGKELLLPKNSQASADEFKTSDIRYPIYFIGNVNPIAIEKMFNQNGIKYQKIHENWNTDIVMFLEDNGISSLLILIFLILFIVLLLSNLYSLKKMNIQNLFGVSNFKDGSKRFLKDLSLFSIGYIISLLIVYIYLWLVHLIFAFRITTYFAILLFLAISVLLLITSGIRCLMHSKTTILSAIRGNSKSRLSFYLNMFTKILVEIFICVSLVGIFKSLKTQSQLQNQLLNWQHHKTLYTMTASPISTDSSEEDYLNKKSMDFFNFIDQRGGLLVDYQGWGNGSDIMDPVNGNVMTVNAQYLRENTVKDIHNKKVSVPKFSKTTFALIPEKFYSEKKQILNSYRDSLGLNDAEKQANKKLPIKAIEIKNNQELFTYSSDAISLGYYSGNTKNAGIIVISNNSLGGLNDKLDSNINWSAYMSDAAFMTPNLSLLRQGIKKFNLTKYVGSIINTKSYVLKNLVEVRSSLFVSVGVFLIALFLAIIENISFNTIYFNNKKKKLAIQFLTGCNFKQRLGKFVALLLAISLLESLVVLLITHQLVIVEGFFIIMTLMELVLLFIQNRRINRNIGSIIKGE